MTPRKRKTLVWGGLALVLLAACFAPEQKPAKELALSRTAAPQPERIDLPRQPKPRSTEVMRLAPREDLSGKKASAAAFEVPGWARPSAPLVAAALPAVPVQLTPEMPPVPFRVMGQYLEEAGLVVFLQEGERSFAVRSGDMVAGNYKVESTDGGVLVLRYLPLNQKQSLELGTAIRNKTDD